jgi:hypothetical protein
VIFAFFLTPFIKANFISHEQMDGNELDWNWKRIRMISADD